MQCNRLSQPNVMCVCSGHCIIYVMAPLVFQTYYPGWTAALLWVAVIRTCFRVGTSQSLPIGQHTLHVLRKQ